MSINIFMFASTTSSVQISGILFLIGSIFGIWNFGISVEALFLTLVGYFIYGCLGIVVTFHRLLTHRSYKTSRTLEKLFSVFGCLGGTGSPIAWAAIHINHHLNSDKAEDPHSPHHKGYKIFFLNYEREINSLTKWRLRDLVTDKFQQILHRYYLLILVAWSSVLFVIGGVYLMIFLHWVPALITIIMSNLVNYIGHKPSWIGSYRNYNLQDKSTNNWVWAIPSWGETWHNNHHRYPKKYYTGEKWWEIDISGAVIKLIRK
jgi:fatty-acid desaturase